MAAALVAAMLAGFYPLARAGAANRATTLRSALGWAALAWSAWTGALWDEGSLLLPYLALCLSGCAGVAVLGARRPGAAAWNFVVAGLLAALLLPAASGLGTPRLEPAHLIFLGATLAVSLLNYLPTRLGWVVPLFGIAGGLEFARLAGANVPDAARWGGKALLALGPWVAWLLLLRPRPARAVDRLWLGFRDRFGFLWAQRVREQFNRAAAHAGWPMRLEWSGLRSPSSDDSEALAALQALLKRFGSACKG